MAAMRLHYVPHAMVFLRKHLNMKEVTERRNDFLGRRSKAIPINRRTLLSGKNAFLWKPLRSEHVFYQDRNISGWVWLGITIYRTPSGRDISKLKVSWLTERSDSWRLLFPNLNSLRKLKNPCLYHHPSSSGVHLLDVRTVVKLSGVFTLRSCWICFYFPHAWSMSETDSKIWRPT